jgi:hypothetical protein
MGIEMRRERFQLGFEEKKKNKEGATGIFMFSSSQNGIWRVDFLYIS